MAGEVGDQNQRFFVAVHVGAGYHAPSNEKPLRSAMKRACLAAASILRKVLSLSHTHKHTILLLIWFKLHLRLLCSNIKFESFATEKYDLNELVIILHLLY